MTSNQTLEARQLSRGLFHHVATPPGTAVIALGQQPAPLTAAAGDGDDAIVAKAREVRALLHQARATGERWAHLFAREQSDAGAATDPDAPAAEARLAEAEARDVAALSGVSRALKELGAMHARTHRGIVAKASVFHPPFSFQSNDNFEHLDLAISILRDLGCFVDDEGEQEVRRRGEIGSKPNQVPNAATSSPFPPVPPSPWLELARASVASLATSSDPLIEILAGVSQRRVMIDDLSTATEIVDSFLDECAELDRHAVTTRPTSPAGAHAALKWARLELVEHYIQEDGDPGEKLILGLVDGATALLDELRGIHADRGSGALPRLYAELRERRTAFAAQPDEHFDASLERCFDLEREALAAPATSIDDALAALSWAQDELIEFNMGDHVALKFIERALGAMRHMKQDRRGERQAARKVARP